MRVLTFAKRNFNEIIRDPLTLVFTLLIPLFLLYIFQQFNIPNDVFKIQNFAPGIIIFSYSFITLFTATLISKDRTSSLLSRLYASPLKDIDFIVGYIISIIPIAIIQSILFFFVSFLFGLTFNINILFCILILIPISLLFISLGILIGSLVNDKAASGIGSIVVQFVVFTSGMYFSLDMLNDVLRTISKILPFSSALDITRAFLNGNYTNLTNPLIILSVYIVIVFIISIIAFKKNMINDNK